MKSKSKDTLEKQREDLLKEVKKIIGEKMERPFSNPTLEVVERYPAVQDVMEGWSALFCQTKSVFLYLLLRLFCCSYE